MSATTIRLLIAQQPQRQDSLNEQLSDLHIAAARLGLYDAADWLWKRALDTAALESDQGTSD